MAEQADRSADRHRTGIISTRLTDPAEDKRFRDLAKRRRLSVSKAVTVAIREWVDRHENETTAPPENEES